MAVYGTLVCTLTDYKGKSANVKVRVPAAKATLANAKTLAEFLEDMSAAAVSGYGVTLGYVDTCIEGKYDRVLQSLVLLFENADGQAIRFSIPAPKDGNVNDDQEPHPDVPEDVKDLLVGIGASSSFIYNGGGLRSRLPNKDARSKEMTGV